MCHAAEDSRSQVCASNLLGMCLQLRACQRTELRIWGSAGRHLQLVVCVVERQDAEEQGVRLVVHLHQRVDRKALRILRIEQTHSICCLELNFNTSTLHVRL